VYGKSFVCIAFPQRHFLPYTQRSISIPVKLDKRAAVRNALKRRARILFVELVAESGVTTSWQLFFFLNKNSLDELKQLIATKNKTSIYEHRLSLCKKDFTYVLRHL
jgi:RNase P protein component